MSKKQLIKDNLLLLIGGNIANVFSFVFIILLLRVDPAIANLYVAFNSIILILGIPSLVLTRAFTIYGPSIFGKLHYYVNRNLKKSSLGLVTFIILLIPLAFLVERFTNQGDLITSFLIITIAIATVVSYAFRGLKQYEQKFLSPVIAINIETGGRLILGYLLGVTFNLGIYGVLIGSLIAMALSTIPSFDIKYLQERFEKLSEIKIITAFAGSFIVTSGLEFFTNFDTAYSLNALSNDLQAQTEYNVLQFFRKIIFYGNFAVSSLILSIGSKNNHSKKFVFGFTLASGLTIGLGGSLVFYLIQPLILSILKQDFHQVSEQTFLIFLLFTTLMSAAYLLSNWLLSIKKRAYLFIPIIASSLQFVIFLIADKNLNGMINAFMISSGIFFTLVLLAGLYEVFISKDKEILESKV